VRIACLLVILFDSFSLWAQERIPGHYNSEIGRYEVENSIYQVKEFRRGLAPFRLHGDYGLIDTSGLIICEPKYEEIEGFMEGVSKVSTFDGSYRYYGFINRAGKEVVPVQYDYAENYIDRSLRFPKVLLVRKGNLYTGYNRQGQILIPEGYTLISHFRSHRALVVRDGKYGFLDTNWQEIIPCEYDQAKDFVFGVSMAKKDGLWGMMDANAGEVLAFIYDDISRFNYPNTLRVKRQGKYGLISDSGKVIIPAIYESFHNLREDKIAVMKEGQYGYINIQGQEVIPFVYEWAGNFSQGFAIAKKDGKWGHISQKGEILSPFIYDKTGDFNQGYAYVQKGDLYGRINLKGQLVIPVEYHGIGPFQNGVAKVTKRVDGIKLRGEVDTSGVLLIPCLYEEYLSFEEDLIPVRSGRLWGYANREWELVIPILYHRAFLFSEGRAQVILNGESFYINKQGQRLP